MEVRVAVAMLPCNLLSIDLLRLLQKVIFVAALTVS
jgi:hypothetical protein